MEIYKKILGICAVLSTFLTFPAVASVYPLTPTTDVVGQVKITTARYEDSFITLAEKYNVGFVEIQQANPNVDPWIPGEGTLVIIPSRHVLPPRNERNGIVINVAEMRLYYFPPGGQQVYTYPLGIGRMDWKTPLGRLSITNKQVKPTWYVPASIQEEMRQEGKPVQYMIGPGPDNPLGEHAMRLSNPSYLIHGTNKPAGIGRRVSHGCINMYPADVAQLFAMVPTGTAVHIVHHPYKVGWADGYLWLEAHPPLEDYQHVGDYSENGLMAATQHAINNKHAEVEWSLTKEFYEHNRGVPMVIGKII